MVNYFIVIANFINKMRVKKKKNSMLNQNDGQDQTQVLTIICQFSIIWARKAKSTQTVVTISHNQFEIFRNSF